MSEPKRYVVRWSDGHYTVNVPEWDGGEVVAAEDYDRLRDERDRELQNAVAETVAEWAPLLDEARALATQLADALREIVLTIQHGISDEQEIELVEMARAALAVFDAKEKPDG